MPREQPLQESERDGMNVLRHCEHAVKVTFDSHGFPTIVGSVAGGPIREHAQRGGKTVEYVPASQLEGAVDRIKALRRVQAREDPDAGRARDFDNWNAALDAAIAAVRGQ